ncbi:MAG: hypothetical protein EP308_11590 [Burkholderiales bacterium]|nr:MAG: hypothetical protein EP308_11590 [Burkholderiales bacterium]
MVGPHAPPLRGSLPPKGADLARGGPSLRSASPPRSTAARVAVQVRISAVPVTASEAPTQAPRAGRRR